MADPSQLLPLADLPIFMSKGDMNLYNDACIDHTQTDRNCLGMAAVKKAQETLSSLLKPRVCRLVVNVAPVLIASVICTMISGEVLRDAANLLMADDVVLNPPWTWTLLKFIKSIIEAKLQEVAMATFSCCAEVSASSQILAVIVVFAAFFFMILLLGIWRGTGGPAWTLSRLFSLPKTLQTPNGPRGWPILGSWTLMQGNNVHRELAKIAWAGGDATRKLMALSVGTTRIVVSCDPKVAKEILRSPVFGDRPLKQAAFDLGFARAIGFATQVPYWRHLRKIAVSHMFSHKQVVTNYESLQRETSRMITAIALHSSDGHSSKAESRSGLCLRPFLQRAAVNNIMTIVFGRHFSFGGSCPEAVAVEAMIREGFELLGGFNCADHLPFLSHLPFLPFSRRCRDLTLRVRAFVQPILEERRRRRRYSHGLDSSRSSSDLSYSFVDVLLSQEGDRKLPDEDMISVLWEMVFRGTDTIAVLTEWALAEVILNPSVQARIHEELDNVVGRNPLVQHKDIIQMPYLQAVLKETLRSHPPGPLLSWARLANEDTNVDGYHIPRGTTAMVNMWAITHDATVWPNPNVFDPSRFMEDEGGVDFDVLGTDVRLAPFGSGRRVCPGRALGIATAQLWVARLLHHFSWSQDWDHPIDLTDNLKLSCEMASPLHGCPTVRIPP